ncbi:unnamed protein product [Cochlearia groenlandica]
MAVQKDYHEDPSPNRPTFLPLKKRVMAGKTLLGSLPYKAGSDSDSSHIGDDLDKVDNLGEDIKKQKLVHLRLIAFYSVLHAFAAETSTKPEKMNQIIEKLMKEWDIDNETHIACEQNVRKNLLAFPQRFASDGMWKQMENKATSILGPVPRTVLTWGSVDPLSLVGKWVRVRMPDEEEYKEYILKEYDPKEETHLLEQENSDADSDVIWIDVREIKREDIVWERGHRPNFQKLSGGYIP